MAAYLKNDCHCTITKAEPGIEYVDGWHFPVQFICGKELSEENNLWIRSLSKFLKGADVAALMERQKLLKSSNKLEAYFAAVINASLRKGIEGDEMTKIIRDYVEKHGIADEFIALGEARGEARGKARGEARGEARGAIALASLVRQGYTVDDALEVLRRRGMTV